MAAADCSPDFLSDVAVVLDPGSGQTKAGFSGEERPRAAVRWSGGVSSYKGGRSSLIGAFRGNLQAAAAPAAVMSSGSPSLCSGGDEGLCGDDWDALENHWGALWEEELGVCPQDHAVLVSDSAVAAPGHRARVAELLFESLSVPAVFLSRRPLLALYSYGLTSGLLLDAGHSASTVCPVYNGYCLPHAARAQTVGGAAVSAYLHMLLKMSQGEGAVGAMSEGVGPVGTEGAWPVLLEEVMRQSCYVSQDFEAELSQRSEVRTQEYQLPDGTTVALGNERFRCTELLFRPSVGGVAQPGLPVLALSSLVGVACEQREELLANVALAGGTSLLPGFSERVQTELERLAPRGSRVRVLAGSHRHIASWLGGSVIASLGTFQRLWVSSADYLEHGPDVVENRCY